MTLRTVFAGILLLFTSVAPSIAQAAVRHPIDIPQQQLGSALTELAKQTHIQVVYTSDLVEGRRARALSGTMTPEEAFTQLLYNSGLRYEFVDAQTVTLSREGGSNAPPTTPAKAGSTQAQTPERTDSTDPKGARKLGFWDRFRLAQADQEEAATDTLTRSETPSSGSGSKLEEIVVTATKRAERLIDTPQSVTVLSTRELSKIGAVQFRDFANSIPGLSLTTAGAGYTQISLRGVTTGFDVSPTVGIYVDDIPYGSSSTLARSAQVTLDVGIFDLDHIEVLRGPQGTLYGASTMGGLIKYVTQTPDASSFGGNAMAGLSGTQDGGVSYNAAGAVNIPLMQDELAVRASGFYSHDGGYIDNLALNRNDVDRSSLYGGRLDLLFKPTEKLSVRVGGFLQDITRDGYPIADYTVAGVPVDGSLDQRHLIPEPFDQHFRLVSGTLSYDFGPAQLASVSSYQTVHSAFSSDISVLFVPLLQVFLNRSYSAVGVEDDVDLDRFTQEVRLVSEGTRVLDWLVGAYYTHENSTYGQHLLLRDPAGQSATNDLFTFSQPGLYNEYAGFGDLTWHLTSRFDLTGGIRYSRNHKRFEQNGTGLLSNSIPELRSEDGVFTYLGNARYHFSEHATGYVRYATGYRSGGANVGFKDPTTGLPVAPPTYDPDQTRSYEIGYKAETSDRRYGADLAAYYIDWSNIIISVVRGGIGATANAPGGATVRGLELSLNARPLDSFHVAGVFAYLNAKMSEANTDLGAAKGERLPTVPRFTAALNGDYALPFASLAPTIGATVRYVGDRTQSFNASTSTQQYREPSYTAVDLRAGLAIEQTTVQFYVRNLLDKRGQLTTPTASISPPGGPRLVPILQPRTIGVNVAMHF